MAISYPNMSVPGASPLIGGSSLADQVQNETEAMRRKRLQAMQNARQLPGGGTSSLAAGYGDAIGMS